MRVAWWVVALLCAGCVEDHLVPCGDLACPVELVCTPGGCAQPENAAACTAVADGDPCTTSSITDGACAGGGCHAIACGDGFVDRGEACDDGNPVAGDGCSADCRSAETCGNQIVDGIDGEQCDEGIPGLSGDGCSSGCTNEVSLWLDAGSGIGPAFRGPSIATGPNGHVVAFGGGGISDTSVGDKTWEWDGVTWMRRDSVIVPRARRGACMAYDSTRRRIVMFGGSDELKTFLADTWEWDGVVWIPRMPSTAPPPRRNAMLSYDAMRDRTVLFGGFSPFGTVLGDTWEWNGVSWTQLFPAQSPPPRGRSAMASDPVRGRTILVGGGSDTTGTWEWDGTTWSDRAVLPLDPGMLVYDPTRARTVLVAGNGMQQWEWNGATWTQLAAPGGPGGGLIWRGIAYDTARSKIVVAGEPFGAQGPVYEAIGSAWSQITPAVGPTNLGALTYDARRGVTVVVDTFTGTWEWDGAAWSRRVLGSPNGTPQGAGGEMAFDTKRGVSVLFAGLQTYLYDGATWSQPAVTNPPTRMKLAYDAKRGKTVAFGGISGASAVNETWEWDGTSWTQRVVTTRPPARSSHTIAYDPSRERVVVFGGQGSMDLLNDTWEWDGTTWTQLVTADAPTPRAHHGMAYDPLRRRLVVAGLPGDVWELGATTWYRRSVLIPTPSDGSLAQDVTGGLIFAGFTLSPLRLRYLSEQFPAERCNAATDSDGDGFVGCADPDCWARCTPLCPPGTTCDPTAPRCGDLACGPVENYVICPQDCAAP